MINYACDGEDFQPASFFSSRIAAFTRCPSPDWSGERQAEVVNAGSDEIVEGQGAKLSRQ